jgi:hypothetical protein
MSLENALEAQEFQRKGQLRWATFIVPLVPGGADRLRQIFKGRAAQSSDPVEKVDTIHELRWVIFDNDTRAVFVTSWDGTLESYLTDFQTKIPDLMHIIEQGHPWAIPPPALSPGVDRLPAPILRADHWLL